MDVMGGKTTLNIKELPKIEKEKQMNTGRNLEMY
jgi:hypothetical protein